MNKIGQPRLGLTDLLMQTKNLIHRPISGNGGPEMHPADLVQPGQPLATISGKKAGKKPESYLHLEHYGV